VKRPLVIALAIIAVGSTAAVAMLREHSAPLPRYGEVPAFAFTATDGKPFGSRDLEGTPWVVDFVFTSCPEVCPRMSEEMARLQTWLVNRGLDGRARLVSVSVDPDRDSPSVLRGYAERFHARPATWIFLTGSQQAIEDAVVRGFKIAVSKEKDTAVQDGFAIVHGTKFVLVDGKRQIRGYYDSNDAAALAALRRDLAALADGVE
jgi:protein SCO1/2